jgi:hypothetical protein
MAITIHKLPVGSFTFLQCLSGTELPKLSETPYMTLPMDKFVHLTGQRHGKSAHLFSFSVHFNQPCDLSCGNIVEMRAESDPIFIPDISK